MISIHACAPFEVHFLTRETLKLNNLLANQPASLQAWCWHEGDALKIDRVGRPPTIAVRKDANVQVVEAEGILEALTKIGDNPAWYLLATPTSPLEDVQALMARWQGQNRPPHEMALALLTGLSGCNLANAGPKLAASMHNLLQTAVRSALSLGISRRDFVNTAIAAYDTVRAGKMEIRK